MQRRNVIRAIIAIGCAVALLLIVLTIFDNDFWDRDAFDELFVGVATFVIAAMLLAMTVIEQQRRILAPCRLVIRTDTRSPPRA